MAGYTAGVRYDAIVMHLKDATTHPPSASSSTCSARKLLLVIFFLLYESEQASQIYRSRYKDLNKGRV